MYTRNKFLFVSLLSTLLKYSKKSKKWDALTELKEVEEEAGGVCLQDKPGKQGFLQNFQDLTNRLQKQLPIQLTNDSKIVNIFGKTSRENEAHRSPCCK